MLRSGFLLNFGTLPGHHKGTEVVELVSVSIGSREEEEEEGFGGEVAHSRGCNCFAARRGEGGGICTKVADKFRRTFPASPLCSLLSRLISQPWDLRGNLVELCDPD